MRLNDVKWPTTELLLRSAGSLEYGLSFMFLPPVLLTGPTRPGYLPLLGAYKSKLFTQVTLLWSSGIAPSGDVVLVLRTYR